MQRNKVLVPLSHDHFHGLMLAQILKKNAPPLKGMPKDIDEKVRYAVEFYNSDLTEHFKSEEEILFPAAKGMDITLDAMLQELINEHRAIKEGISALASAKDLPEEMDKLGRLLEGHIRKEERVVFPRIELLLTEDKLKQLDGKFNPVRKNESDTGKGKKKKGSREDESTAE
ncbi:MAG: hemerythrin domain-containing protein [Bacillota bacterium]